MSLQSVHDVQGSHGLAASVLRVRHGVSDDILEKDLEHASRLLVDQSRDALDSSSTSKAANCRLGDALDVVSQHLTMSLGTRLPQSLSSFASSSHSSQMTVSTA